MVEFVSKNDTPEVIFSFLKYFKMPSKLIEINYSNQKLNLKEVTKSHENYTVISFIGPQSSGKSTCANHMFSTEFQTDTFRTTTGCDYCFSDNFVILDVKGYMSPDSEIEIFKLHKNQDQAISFKECNNINICTSQKLGTLVWNISNVIVFCFKFSELNSSNMFQMLLTLQEDSKLVEINKPSIFFVCINDSSSYSDETTKNIESRISHMVVNYEIIRNVKKIRNIRIAYID